ESRSSGSRYAASILAGTPPSEGQGVTGLELLIKAMPARQNRGGCCRFDKERLAVDCDQHRVSGVTALEDRQRRTTARVANEDLTTLPCHRSKNRGYRHVVDYRSVA